MIEFDSNGCCIQCKMHIPLTKYRTSHSENSCAKHRKKRLKESREDDALDFLEHNNISCSEVTALHPRPKSHPYRHPIITTFGAPPVVEQEGAVDDQEHMIENEYQFHSSDTEEVDNNNNNQMVSVDYRFMLSEYVDLLHLKNFSHIHSDEKKADEVAALNRFCKSIHQDPPLTNAKTIFRNNTYLSSSRETCVANVPLDVPFLGRQRYYRVRNALPLMLKGPQIDLSFLQKLATQDIADIDDDHIYNSCETGASYVKVAQEFPGCIVIPIELFSDSAYLGTDSRSLKGSIDCVVATCAIFGSKRYCPEGGGVLISAVPLSSEISHALKKEAWERLKESPEMSPAFQKKTFAHDALRNELFIDLILNLESVLGAPLHTKVRKEFQDDRGNKQSFDVVFVISLLQMDTKGLRELSCR